MADRSVIGELKAEMQLPNLDLDVLVMGQYQLLGKPDLPKNVDLADTQTISGNDALGQEMKDI